MNYRVFMIRVENLKKTYFRKLGAAKSYHALRDLLSFKMFSKKKTTEEFQALNEVSFSVKPGEKVGIIGPNGSGKSTLLKIISRVTTPSQGYVELDGRVASLLEVGTGFHPELSGIENIYLNGAILGMSKKEIEENLQDIIEFSEIGDFIHTPVKHYSSGMFVRLAFSVAAHLNSDLLILDEVLAVGDHRFQEKCFNRIEGLSRADKTILFVSHNMGAIQTFCDRVIVLNKGNIIYDGAVAAGVERYLSINKQDVNVSFVLDQKNLNLPIEITKAWLTKIDSTVPTNEIHFEERAHLWIEYEIRKPIHNTVIAILLSREAIPLLYVYDTDLHTERSTLRKPGYYKERITICSDLLKEGHCEIAIKVGYGQENLTNPDCKIVFNVVNYQYDLSNKAYRYERPGCLRKALIWEQISEHSFSETKEAV